MAFRDPNDALREELDAAHRRIRELEATNDTLRAKHSPRERRLSAALGVLLVLGSGLAWHLLMQNRGLEVTARQSTHELVSVRDDLDRALEARASAENAVLAAEHACRDGARTEDDRAHAARE
jgi:hypothetical protein